MVAKVASSRLHHIDRVFIHVDECAELMSFWRLFLDSLWRTEDEYAMAGTRLRWILTSCGLITLTFFGWKPQRLPASMAMEAL